MKGSASAARSRLSEILLKGHPFVSFFLVLEAMVNMLGQREHLNPASDIYFILVLTSVLCGFLAFWKLEIAQVSIRVFSGLVFLSLFLWPFFLADSTSREAISQPWIWWLLGIGCITSVLAFNFVVGSLYISSLSVFWLFLHASPLGGGVALENSFQDASYLFLISFCLSGVLFMLRRAAISTDAANTEAIKRAIDLAKIEALDRERARVDALVHDRVLNALLTAAKARTRKEQKAAALLASEALSALDSSDALGSEDPVNASGLFQALETAAVRLGRDVKIEVKSSSLLEIPSEVAVALTEATLQALDNAIRHSSASEVRLTMSASALAGVEISVTDDGKGFRLARVPKNRIGIETSIIQRAILVGARANIDSEPGNGTRVKLEWRK